jgi:YbgC/YbaW family acyl-CoA thioester hydrolase
LKNSPVAEKITVRYADLDPYGHLSNAVYLSFFGSVRIACLRTLSTNLGLGPLEAGDLPGVGYVIAEATVRYTAPVFLDDPLYDATSVRSVGKRSFVMDYELHTGEHFDKSRMATEGTSAQVFYDLKTRSIRRRPEWFLSAVADLEGRPEESLALEGESC